MKMPWYSVSLFLFLCLEPLLRKNSWMRATSATVMITFTKVPFWILLDHNYVERTISTVTRHIDNTAFSRTPYSWRFYVCGSIYVLNLSSKLEGALSGLRHFLASESPLKMMKNVFYLTLKTFFVLKVFKFHFLVLTFWSCMKTTSSER